MYRDNKPELAVCLWCVELPDHIVYMPDVKMPFSNLMWKIGWFAFTLTYISLDYRVIRK